MSARPGQRTTDDSTRYAVLNDLMTRAEVARETGTAEYRAWDSEILEIDQRAWDYAAKLNTTNLILSQHIQSLEARIAALEARS